MCGWQLSLPCCWCISLSCRRRHVKGGGGSPGLRGFEWCETGGPEAQPPLPHWVTQDPSPPSLFVFLHDSLLWVHLCCPLAQIMATATVVVESLLSVPSVPDERTLTLHSLLQTLAWCAAAVTTQHPRQPPSALLQKPPPRWQRWVWQPGPGMCPGAATGLVPDACPPSRRLPVRLPTGPSAGCRACWSSEGTPRSPASAMRPRSRRPTAPCMSTATLGWVPSRV